MGGELKNRERLSITLEPELAGRVRKLADRQGVSISAVIERFIREQIGEREVVADLQDDPLTEAVIEQLLRPENIARAAKLVGQVKHDSDLMQKREEVLKGSHKQSTSGAEQ